MMKKTNSGGENKKERYPESRKKIEESVGNGGER